MKDTSNEVYNHEDQTTHQDANKKTYTSIVKKIHRNLVKSFIVAELDKDNSIDEFLKIDFSHAVGVMEGCGTYGGVTSKDETWIYEYEDGRTTSGGIAVVRDNKVVDFHSVFQKLPRS